MDITCHTQRRTVTIFIEGERILFFFSFQRDIDLLKSRGKLTPVEYTYNQLGKSQHHDRKSHESETRASCVHLLRAIVRFSNGIEKFDVDAADYIYIRASPAAAAEVKLLGL